MQFRHRSSKSLPQLSLSVSLRRDVLNFRVSRDMYIEHDDENAQFSPAKFFFG